MPTLASTCTKMSGGAAATAGVGKDFRLSLSGTWTAGDTVQIVATDAASGVNVLSGAGDITGKHPVYVFTFKNKVYYLAGASFYFSALAEPTRINDPNGSGNGFVEAQNFNSMAEDLVALASYQGRLAVFSRRTVQIWQVDADPALYAVVQLLQNIGTMAKESVKSVGDLDVYFLSDSGVRSLRVRDNTLNAFVVDIGSPIDQLLQAAILSSSSETNENACAVVEPISNRYWLYLKGVLYVLSNFPTNKIAAWSTFVPFYTTEQSGTILPTSYDAVTGQATVQTITPAAGDVIYWEKGANDASVGTTVAGVLRIETGYFIYPGTGTVVVSGTAGAAVTAVVKCYKRTTFLPQLFSTFKNQVFARTSTSVVAYGSTDNKTYDTTTPVLEIPWLAAKTPGSNKTGESVDVVGSGQWKVEAGMDPIGNTLDQTSQIGSQVSPSTRIDASPDRWKFPLQGYGTHFKLKATGIVGPVKQILSSMIFHYSDEGEK